MSGPDRWEVRHVPGVGTTVQLRDLDDREVTIVVRHDGRCDLYPPDGAVSFTLDEVTASAVGGVLIGRPVIAPSLLRRLDGLLGTLRVESLVVPSGSALAGRSIEEVGVRRRTGVTVVAIVRGMLPTIAPEPSAVMSAGDELILIGRVDDIADLSRLLGEPGHVT